MDVRVEPMARIFGLNTDLLLNCLDGLSEEDARRRLAGGGNSIAFLTAHLTDTRHFLAARLGHPLDNPLTRYLADANSIDEIRELPELEQLQAAWLRVSDHLGLTLERIDGEELDRPNAHRFPLEDSTQVGLITFLAQHDSYHVGQIGFIRRQLGKPAMAYTRRS